MGNRNGNRRSGHSRMRCLRGLSWQPRAIRSRDGHQPRRRGDPQCLGEIVEIPVKANQLIKAGSLLFKIEPVPYSAQVRIIEAQLKLQEQRLQQMTQLLVSGSGRAFDVQQRKLRSNNSGRSSIRRSSTWIKQRSLRQPTAMSATSRSARVIARLHRRRSCHLLSPRPYRFRRILQNGYQTVRPGRKSNSRSRITRAASTPPLSATSSAVLEKVRLWLAELARIRSKVAKERGDRLGNLAHRDIDNFGRYPGARRNRNWRRTCPTRIM